MSTNGVQKIPMIGVPPEPAKKAKAPKKKTPKTKAPTISKKKPSKLKSTPAQGKLNSKSETCAYRLFVQTHLWTPEFFKLSKNEKKQKRKEAWLEFQQKKKELTKQWDMFKVKPHLETQKQRKALPKQQKELKSQPRPLMEKIIKPIEEKPKSVPTISSEQRGYQYLKEDWLKTTLKSSPLTNSEHEPFVATAIYPPLHSYSNQPSTSQYIPPAVPSETNYPTFLSQIASYQKPQEPSAYHKMFHSSTPITPQALPVDMEAAVAMQQRLLEIEKELEEIERQKAEMAMADELRRREAELKEKERELERKEREIRRREEEMRRRKRSRSSSRDRSYRGKERSEDRREDRRSSHHRHDTRTSSSSRPSAFQPSLTSSSFPSPSYRSEIRIETRDRRREERDADAARRHGQKRRRLPSGQDEHRRGSSRHLASHPDCGKVEFNDISDDDNW